jgi:hypothetical protein
MSSQISALTPFSGNYAYAIICVRADDISNIFRIKDPSSSNPIFYIDASGFSQLIVSTDTISNSNNNYGTISFSNGKKISERLSHAYVYGTSNGILDYNIDTSNNPYTVDNKTIKSDVLRNLANYLFNTQYGVKILNNYSSILSNMDTLVHSIFTVTDNSTNIYGILNTANGMSATNDTINNIGLQIYNAINSAHPDRMNSLVAVDISNNIYKMPLYEGDSIYMILRINYPADQGSIVGKSSAPSPRNYQVRLKLV